jgi:hypothetical protein
VAVPYEAEYVLFNSTSAVSTTGVGQASDGKGDKKNTTEAK